MCRGNEYHDFRDRREGDRLNIRAFHLSLYVSHADHSEPLPETLTLVYFPRVVNLSPAYVALHQVRPTGPVRRREAAYASTDRVQVGSGERFEIYIGGERVLKGGSGRGATEVNQAVEPRKFTHSEFTTSTVCFKSEDEA
ncbi:hypothetical protein QJS10_CPB15g00874 [Acorus calamus]|uniref:Uncharacterized protein n=1 Tax=Acorus calamus TaxID=4465 RepID=A0AAV9D9Q8_ACOCL|nr:hypothetical protein QJS10_CPB15g00874 [Acorus calamus]